MEPETRFELVTYCLRNSYSTPELLRLVFNNSLRILAKLRTLNKSRHYLWIIKNTNKKNPCSAAGFFPCYIGVGGKEYSQSPEV